MLKAGPLRDAANARRLEPLFAKLGKRSLEDDPTGCVRTLLLGALALVSCRLGIHRQDAFCDWRSSSCHTLTRSRAPRLIRNRIALRTPQHAQEKEHLAKAKQLE